MAGFSVEISKLDTGASPPYPKIVSSGLTVTLRIDPYSGTTYTLDEVGTTGVYNKAVVADGVYKLYIGGAEQTQYKTFWIGDEALTYLPEIEGGIYDCTGKYLINPADPNSGVCVGDRDFNDARYGKLAAVNSWAALQTFLAGIDLSDKALINPLDPTAGTHIGDRDYNDARYLRFLIAANIDMAGFIFTNLGAGTANGHSVRWQDVMRLADIQTATGAKTFSGNNTYSGISAFSGAASFNAQVEFYTKCPISDVIATLATHLTTKYYVDNLGSIYVTVIGNQTIAGNKTLTGANIHSGTNLFKEQVTFENKIPKVSSSPANGLPSPTDDAHFTTKKYVDAAIVSASGNYVESINEVAVFPELSANIPGVAYRDMTSAINSFVSPGINNQCCVLIKGTGISNRYIQCNVSALKDYVHIRGLHKRINIILGIAVETVTDQNMMFEDCSIFLGVNTNPNARTFANVQFVNCDIYVYNDITFNGTNLKLENCNIYSANGHDITYSGAGKITGCHFMQNTTASGWTGIWAGNYNNENNSYVPPTDPSPLPPLP